MVVVVGVVGVVVVSAVVGAGSRVSTSTRERYRSPRPGYESSRADHAAKLRYEQVHYATLA